MSVMRTLFLFFFVGIGTYWAWNFNPTARNMLEGYFETGEFLTLEARYTPQDIMKANETKLLGNDEGRVFLEPTLQFHPYLLLDIKYSQGGSKTKESLVLWGLNDGEMVLDTGTWDTSHGFEDCINAGATRNDFKVVNVLAKSGGSLDRDALMKKLGVEPSTLDDWLTSALEKNLVTRSGDKFRLHFENPRLEVTPQTRIAQRLVTKPYKHAKRVVRRHSRSEIERNAQAAFGTNFAVRGHREVFLPVYNVEVENPDGSVASSYWNALNGKQITNLELQ